MEKEIGDIVVYNKYELDRLPSVLMSMKLKQMYLNRRERNKFRINFGTKIQQ